MGEFNLGDFLAEAKLNLTDFKIEEFSPELEGLKDSKNFIVEESNYSKAFLSKLVELGL